MNTRLIDSLAQVILALSEDEQQLLGQKIQQLRHNAHLAVDLEQFFQSLDELEPDPDQPSLEDISLEVRTVRQQLWASR